MGATSVRLCLLGIDEGNNTQCIWRYDARKNDALAFQRIKNVVADDCKVTGGAWQTEVQTGVEPAFIIEGKKASTYNNYFQMLEDFNRAFTSR